MGHYQRGSMTGGKRMDRGRPSPTDVEEEVLCRIPRWQRELLRWGEG
jgi:hypothetical protein